MIIAGIGIGITIAVALLFYWLQNRKSKAQLESLNKSITERLDAMEKGIKSYLQEMKGRPVTPEVEAELTRFVDASASGIRSIATAASIDLASDFSWLRTSPGFRAVTGRTTIKSWEDQQPSEKKPEE